MTLLLPAHQGQVCKHWQLIASVLLPVICRHSHPFLSALQKEERWLYGVDVTCSRFLSRPEVLRAAHFAAEAHAGQVRGYKVEGCRHGSCEMIIDQCNCSLGMRCSMLSHSGSAWENQNREGVSGDDGHSGKGGGSDLTDTIHLTCKLTALTSGYGSCANLCKRKLFPEVSSDVGCSAEGQFLSRVWHRCG